MLQLNPVYSLWNRRKTLTGSPDTTHAIGTNKPCMDNVHASGQHEVNMQMTYVKPSEMSPEVSFLCHPLFVTMSFAARFQSPKYFQLNKRATAVLKCN